MILVFLYFTTSKFDQFTRKLNSFSTSFATRSLNAISFNEPVVNCITSPPPADIQGNNKAPLAIGITLFISFNESQSYYSNDLYFGPFPLFRTYSHLESVCIHYKLTLIHDHIYKDPCKYPPSIVINL